MGTSLDSGPLHSVVCVYLKAVMGESPVMVKVANGRVFFLSDDLILCRLWGETRFFSPPRDLLHQRAAAGCIWLRGSWTRLHLGDDGGAGLLVVSIGGGTGRLRSG